MTAKITVVVGPPWSGKTDHLLARYASALAESPPGSVLWLSPNWRTAAAMRGRLVDRVGGGCFSPGVMTFAQFAETLLQQSPEPIRPITPLMKRQLVRRLLDEQMASGRLTHFRPIAGTGGLLDLVCGFLREMKRLEIWPEDFRRACQSRGMTSKDRELLELYEAYQARLLAHHLYDAEGRFWSARDRLQKDFLAGDRNTRSPSRGSQGLWKSLRVVMAHGFTDFTRTEHEILETLAHRADELWISLPLEPEPCRRDLFRKPLRTLDELHRRFGPLEVQRRPRTAAPVWPALAHIEQHLFGNPRQAVPAADTTGVEILASSGTLGELQAIGRRIKRLLTEGDAVGPAGVPVVVRPSDVAVVFRRVEGVGQRVTEVFASLGLPVVVESSRVLARAPTMVALLALLRLDRDDWPMGDLLAVLGSNFFRPAWPAWCGGKAAVEVEAMVRHVQVPKGRQALRARLADSAEDVRVEACRGVLAALAAAFDTMPERATLAEWLVAWRRLAQETGLLSVLGEESEQIAWQQLETAISEAAQLAECLGEALVPLDRAEALANLLDILATQRQPARGDMVGCVQVLSAASARGLQIPYLFLAGLTENSFPSPDRGDRLYSEGESQQFIDSGLPLAARRDRASDEMLLFYEVLHSATRRLWLSYAALDEAGESLTPSPYLKEVEQACGDRRIARWERIDLSPVPGEEDLLCVDAFRIGAVARALEGDVGLLAGLLRYDARPLAAGKAVVSPGMGPGENLLSGLSLLAMRQDRQEFSAAEGMFFSPAAERHMERLFPAERVFGATELESYASCPYRYQVERLLQIKPLEEGALAVDYRPRGNLAHELLAMLHERVNQAAGRPASPADLTPEEYERILSELLVEASSPAATGTVEGALREVDRRVVRQWLADYRSQHEKYDGQWRECESPLRPALFEISFGRPPREADLPPSTAEPLVLVSDDKEVRLSGRIDRVDTGTVAGHLVFTIVDYKTGQSPKITFQTVTRGLSLQLPLYALAVAELIFADRDAVPWQAGYWLVADRGFKTRSALKLYEERGGAIEPSVEWEEIRAALATAVVRLVESLRKGQFPVFSANPDCTGFCPFASVCRINHVRSLEKSWAPLG